MVRTFSHIFLYVIIVTVVVAIVAVVVVVPQLYRHLRTETQKPYTRLLQETELISEHVVRQSQHHESTCRVQCKTGLAEKKR